MAAEAAAAAAAMEAAAAPPTNIPAAPIPAGVAAAASIFTEAYHQLGLGKLPPSPPLPPVSKRRTHKKTAIRMTLRDRMLSIIGTIEDSGPLGVPITDLKQYQGCRKFDVMFDILHALVGVGVLVELTEMLTKRATRIRYRANTDPITAASILDLCRRDPRRCMSSHKLKMRASNIVHGLLLKLEEHRLGGVPCTIFEDCTAPRSTCSRTSICIKVLLECGLVVKSLEYDGAVKFSDEWVLSALPTPSLSDLTQSSAADTHQPPHVLCSGVFRQGVRFTAPLKPVVLKVSKRYTRKPSSAAANYAAGMIVVAANVSTLDAHDPAVRVRASADRTSITSPPQPQPHPSPLLTDATALDVAVVISSLSLPTAMEQ